MVHHGQQLMKDVQIKHFERANECLSVFLPLVGSRKLRWGTVNLIFFSELGFLPVSCGVKRLIWFNYYWTISQFRSSVGN